MTMTQEERNEYVSYRLKSAFTTFDAAKVLAENGFWNSAVNRLYYAVFYAVNALLVNNGIYSSSHSGIRSQFSMHFIKSGKLDLKYGKLLSELYDWRQKGDYDNIFDYDRLSVEPLFEVVEEMIKAIQVMIDK
ncbi:MAG TPA: hypothetical protein DER09_06945 [Prolixibacteraceae bacterium]|nr:hypothetical protein [Prolixibacteraceae bacterium]